MIIGCIIQARMGSTRLPGKVLMKLDKQNTVLDYVIQQLKHCKNIEKIIIATTSLKEDDVIETFAKNNNILYFRGNSLDVLDRYYQCAKLHNLTIIIRITADNPLVDPNIVEKVLTEFKLHSYDYVSNAIVRSFPYGTETEVFSFDALEKGWNNVKHQNDLSSFRWTVDQIEDFTLVKNIISKINKRPILIEDIINLLTEEPDLYTINKNVQHNHLG